MSIKLLHLALVLEVSIKQYILRLCCGKTGDDHIVPLSSAFCLRACFLAKINDVELFEMILKIFSSLLNLLRICSGTLVEISVSIVVLYNCFIVIIII